MIALLACCALLAGAWYTGWLYWLALLYGAFTLTFVLLSGTKVGKALLAFASEPKPTTAAGWLNLGNAPRKQLTHIEAAAAPAPAAPLLPLKCTK